MATQIWLTYFNKILIDGNELFKVFDYAINPQDTSKTILSVPELKMSLNSKIPVSAKPSSFVPLRFVKLTLEELNTWINQSLSIENEPFSDPKNSKQFFDDLEKKFVEKELGFTLSLIKESPDNIYLFVNFQANAQKDFKEIIKTIINDICGDFGYDYTRFFINNTFSNNWELLKPDEGLTKVLKEQLHVFAKDRMSAIAPEKSKADQYEERFGFRPFYGEGIKKLPKVDLAHMRLDWDAIYINPNLSNEEDNPVYEDGTKTFVY